MEKCIFCEIVEKRVPAFIVYEDDDCIAFLDIKPRSKGMTLIVPRKHFKSFDEDFDSFQKTFKIAHLIGLKIKQALNPNFIIFSILPAEVPHFHIRLYPVYGQAIPLIEANPLPTNEKELKELAEKIRSVEIKREEKEEAKEIVRTREEIEWLRRYRERA